MNTRNQAELGVSVCIPAHNEERTIEPAVRSVLHQDWGKATKSEILIGANACADGTADVVRQISSEYPGKIRLFETDTKGKPNTWNMLREAASFDLMVFMDGDVQLERTAIGRLLNLLHNRDDLILAQGTNAAVLRECDWFTRLIRPLPNRINGVFVKDWQDHTCGRLYAIRKPGIEKIMSDLGFEAMPTELIHEDGWLRRLLDISAARHRGLSLYDVLDGEGRYWEVCPDALVFFVPPNWREDVKMAARTLHAREQLDRMFPEWADISRQRSLEKLGARSWNDRFSALLKKDWKNASRRLLNLVAQRLVNWQARRRYDKDVRSGRYMTSETFARSEFSKRPVATTFVK